MGFRLIFLEENMCKESNEMLNEQIEEAISRMKMMNLLGNVIDDFKNINEKIVDYGVPAFEIYKLIKEKGYKGSYSSVKRYFKTIKGEKTKQLQYIWDFGRWTMSNRPERKPAFRN